MTGSWMTTIAGYAVILMTVVQQALSGSALPGTVFEWISFAGQIITGIGLALAKDYNKTNAPNPLPDSVRVEK